MSYITHMVKDPPQLGFIRQLRETPPDLKVFFEKELIPSVVNMFVDEVRQGDERPGRILEVIGVELRFLTCTKLVAHFFKDFYWNKVINGRILD